MSEEQANSKTIDLDGAKLSTQSLYSLCKEEWATDSKLADFPLSTGHIETRKGRI